MSVKKKAAPVQEQHYQDVKENKLVPLIMLYPHKRNVDSNGSQSGFSYNFKLKSGIMEELKLLCQRGARNTRWREHNLMRGYAMTTLPHHAHDDNSSFIPATSGIYKITCLANGKIYIGSASNLRERRNAHFRTLRQNKHTNLHLQRAWNKYGAQAFTFEVLELVLPISLTAREQYWFNKTKPFGDRGFNILTTAGSPSGYKHTPEAIEKIRESNRRREISPIALEQMRQANIGNTYCLGREKSPEHREKLRQARLGTKSSPETREKVGKASRGRKHSPEHIEKQRQAVLGRKKSPEAIEKYRKAAQDRWRLSPAEIEAIQADRNAGMTYRQLIKKYGIGGTRLAQIFRGEL